MSRRDSEEAGMLLLYARGEGASEREREGREASGATPEGGGGRSQCTAGECNAAPRRPIQSLRQSTFYRADTRQ